MGKWAKVAAKNGVELPVAAPVAAPKETKEEKKARLQEEKRKQKAAKKRAKLYARDPAEEEMEATIAQLENGPTKFAMQAELDKLTARNKKKRDKKKMKRMAELRELINLFEMPQGDDEAAIAERDKAELILKEYNEELEELQEEFNAREAAAAAEAAKNKPKPRPPVCPEGYKWGRGNHLSAGATFDAANLLMAAAREGDVKEFKLIYSLLEGGGHDMIDLINTYVCWPEGWNALHCAVHCGSRPLVDHLIALRADLSIAGPGGCTALSIASDRGHRGLVNLFRLRGFGLTREWYFQYDRCVETCSIPGCTNVAEGMGGVCHGHMATRAQVIKHYHNEQVEQSKNAQLRGTKVSKNTLSFVKSSNQTTCIGGSFRPEWRPHLEADGSPRKGETEPNELALA